MKIIIAPNAFKNCLSAQKVAQAMAKGVYRAAPNAKVELIPLSDGGDGFLAALAPFLEGEFCSCTVSGPRFAPQKSKFLYLPKEKTALIEIAQVSGLALLEPNERDPSQTSTQGVGELIQAALKLNINRLLIGLGGSATCDGGIGMASALGIHFYDSSGQKLKPIGENLSQIAAINRSELEAKIEKVEIKAFCDVKNPLIGPTGAALLYSPQKGASPTQAKKLEKGMLHFSNKLTEILGKDFATLPYGGAAGGLAIGLHAFLNASLVSGSQAILDLLQFDSKKADLILTAEGEIDSQTSFGKLPIEVAKWAKRKKIPCFAFAGKIPTELTPFHKEGMSALFSICNGPLTQKESMEKAFDLLTFATAKAIHAFLRS